MQNDMAGQFALFWPAENDNAESSEGAEGAEGRDQGLTEVDDECPF
jgi:hypothetical protein